MAISTISGLSAASMNPISSVRAREVRPEAYALDNQSEVSDAFQQSLAMQGVGGINAPTPVQYPNAQIQENTINASEQSKQVNQMFNNIASAYQGMSTSYNSRGGAEGYGMVGSQIDLLA